MRRPSPAILGSIALHGGVVALAFVSWPRKEPTPLVNSVPVSIISEIPIAAAPVDNPQEEESPDDGATAPVETPPEAAPDPEPTPPTPTPPTPPRPTPPPEKAPTPRPTPAPTPRPTPPPEKAPPRPTPTPTPPPKKTTPAPTPAPSRPNPTPTRPRTEPSLDLDALAGPSRPTGNPGRPAAGQSGQGAAPRASGPQLAALASQITPHWNLNCDMPGADALTIRVRVRMTASGQITGNPVLDQPRSDPVWRAAADGMLRAVRAAAPFDVPDGFEAQEVPFRFETASMCRNR